MKQLRTTTMAAVAGLGALALLSIPSFAAGDHGSKSAAPGVQLAHMTKGPSSGEAEQPCPMGTTARGMMGQGMMGQGMMGQGSGMGHGTMMGPGMMGPGYGMGRGSEMHAVPKKDLSTDDVRHFLKDSLAHHGNKRLKVGDVKEGEDGTIIAEIVTADESLVQRFKVDRHTGRMRQID